MSEWRIGAADAWGTSRVSRLFPQDGRLVHADLHNHTMLSDGSGDPREAFASLRANGLDAAALTDHTTPGSGISALAGGRRPPVLPQGLDPAGWKLVDELAEKAHDEGIFVTLRGFEWSHPLFGHVSVWDTDRYTDPVRTPAMRPLYRWLRRSGGLGGFNHPGKGDPARFGGFRLDRRAPMVSVEMFNKLRDHLLVGAERERLSPLVRCLDAGWRVAIAGATDEHGTDWGAPEHKGRTGLYVTDLSRDGVRDALVARRAFASRMKGLRLDAAADGVRMGGVVAAGDGLRVEADIDGPGWAGRRVLLQVLSTGRPLPRVAAAAEVRVPGPGEPLPALDVDLGGVPGDWLVLRVADLEQPGDPAAPPGSPFAQGWAVAYASPWWRSPGP